MNDQETESSKGARAFALLLLGPVAICLLYVLSIGPAAAMCEHYDWDPQPLQTFYYPLIWLHENTFLREPLEWYVGLFGVK